MKNISARMLRKWRRQALLISKMIEEKQDQPLSHPLADILVQQILRLTQELLDQHLMEK